MKSESGPNMEKMWTILYVTAKLCSYFTWNLITASFSTIEAGMGAGVYCDFRLASGSLHANIEFLKITAPYQQHET